MWFISHHSVHVFCNRRQGLIVLTWGDGVIKVTETPGHQWTKTIKKLKNLQIFFNPHTDICIQNIWKSVNCLPWLRILVWSRSASLSRDLWAENYATIYSLYVLTKPANSIVLFMQTRNEYCSDKLHVLPWYFNNFFLKNKTKPKKSGLYPVF